MDSKSVRRHRQAAVFLCSFCMVVILAWLDHVTGRRYSFGPFYLIPILLVGWFSGRAAALLMTALAILGGVWADYGWPPYFTGTRYWATAMRVLFYSSPVLLLIKLREALEKARELSRVDFLTGIANRRTFHEQAEMEKNRARRYLHPLTVAYLDIDDFRHVNDLLGHAGGDEVLVAIARLLQENLRDTDFVARIGGDEFGILLPETDRYAAQFVIGKLHTVLQQVGGSFRAPVTCSIGAATFSGELASLEQMIAEADKAMYAAKRNGKSQVVHAEIA